LGSHIEFRIPQKSASQQVAAWWNSTEDFMIRVFPCQPPSEGLVAAELLAKLAAMVCIALHLQYTTTLLEMDFYYTLEMVNYWRW